MSLGDVSIHHKNIVLLHCPNMFCPSIKMIRLVHKDLVHENIVLLHCPNMFCPSIKMIRLVHKDLVHEKSL